MELKWLLTILSLLVTVARTNVSVHAAPEAEDASAPAPLLDFHLRETSVVRAMRNVLEALRDSLMSQPPQEGDLEISSLLDGARKQLGSPSLRDVPAGATSLDSLTQELVDFVKDVAVQEVALEAFRQVFTDAALSGVEDPVEADQASATIEMGQVLQKIQDRLKAGGFPEKLVREALPAISGCGLRFDQATAAVAEASANARSLQRLSVAVPLLLEEEAAHSSRGDDAGVLEAKAQGQTSESSEAPNGLRSLQQRGVPLPLLLEEEGLSSSLEGAGADESSLLVAKAQGEGASSLSELPESASSRRLQVAVASRPGQGNGPNDRHGGGRHHYPDYGHRPPPHHHHHHHHHPHGGHHHHHHGGHHHHHHGGHHHHHHGGHHH